MELFGWITPSRVFIPTRPWDHLTAVLTNKALGSLVPDLEEIQESLENIHNDCERSACEEGNTHSEWHRYEMACDRARDNLIDRLYTAGAIRVGSTGEDVCFEGTPDAIKNLYQYCRDLAEQHNKRPNFEPRRNQ